MWRREGSTPGGCGETMLDLVTAVCPGPILTDRQTQLLEDLARRVVLVDVGLHRAMI